MGEAKPYDALTSAAQAFASGSRDVWQSLHSRSFSASREIGFPNMSSEMEELLNDYDRAITLVALGVNLDDYERFLEATPRVQLSVSGKFDTALTKAISVELEDVRWCIDFVVEFMLRAEERKRSARSNQLTR